MEEEITSDKMESVGKRRSFKIVADNASDDESVFDEAEEEENCGDDSMDYQAPTNRSDDSTHEDIPLELRRDNMSVEEVAMEEYKRACARRVRTIQERETRSNAKGDTRITFITTGRGGKLAVFRGYPFNKSNTNPKTQGKVYYRCETKNCRATLTLLNEKFCAAGGEHNHESRLDEKMKRGSVRRQKMERAQMNREKRLEQLKQKEIERRNNSLAGISGEEVTVTTSRKNSPAKSRNVKASTSGLTESIVDSISLEDIDEMPTNVTFDNELFENFTKKMSRHFDEISNFGMLQSDLQKDWDTLKVQIRQLAKRKNKVKDQRYHFMRAKLDKAVAQQEIAVKSKEIMEEKIRGLNIAGAQLLINQVKELQGIKESYKIVDGEVVASQVDQYKSMYEKAVKERDLLKLRIKDLASAASSFAVLSSGFTNTSTDINHENSNGSVPTPESAVVTHVQISPNVSRNSTNSSNNQHQVNQHQFHSQSVIAFPSYSQTLQLTPQQIYQERHHWT